MKRPKMYNSSTKGRNERRIMPTHEHYVEVAKALKRRVSSRDFKRMSINEIVEMLREASGENCGLSDSTAMELERALLNENVRVFPHLKGGAEGAQAVRLFSMRGAIAEFLDALTQPSDATDVRLAEILRKVDGMKSLLEVDDDLINRLEAIFSEFKLEWIYADGEELVAELKQRRLDEATRPKGRPVDDDFIKHIENAREIVREATGGRKLTDSVEIIREMREERDAHLQGIDGDAIIERLNKVRKEVSGGRVFSDSATLIREMREERDKELDRAIRGRKE